jgi:hypothetical protein
MISLLLIKAEPKTMKNTLAGVEGAAMSPPRGNGGGAPKQSMINQKIRVAQSKEAPPFILVIG